LSPSWKPSIPLSLSLEPSWIICPAISCKIQRKCLI
jgi:hypothetical protein